MVKGFLAVAIKIQINVYNCHIRFFINNIGRVTKNGYNGRGCKLLIIYLLWFTLHTALAPAGKYVFVPHTLTRRGCPAHRAAAQQLAMNGAGHTVRLKRRVETQPPITYARLAVIARN